VIRIEGIDEHGICTVNNAEFELSHEATDRQPKIIPDRQHALHVPAIALEQGSHEFCIGPCLPLMQPLLELVQYEQDFLTGTQLRSLTQLA
jgi:hypothetical protein